MHGQECILNGCYKKSLKLLKSFKEIHQESSFCEESRNISIKLDKFPIELMVVSLEVIVVYFLGISRRILAELIKRIRARYIFVIITDENREITRRYFSIGGAKIWKTRIIALLSTAELELCCCFLLTTYNLNRRTVQNCQAYVKSNTYTCQTFSRTMNLSNVNVVNNRIHHPNLLLGVTSPLAQNPQRTSTVII